MLGHLVYGRYSGEDYHPAVRDRSGWIEKILHTLLRRRAR
jgi:hypothetical protein